MLKIFLLIIIIIVIFYILNKCIFKKNIQENYLTYFAPFYDDNINALSTFYDKKENNLNYFKKKFNYEKIYFNFNTSNIKFIKFLITSYIANSKVQNIHLNYTKNNIDSIEILNNNKNYFAITDYPSIVYYSEVLHKNVNNIKLITNLFKIYLYIFTKEKYHIFSINDIKPGTLIGIVNNSNISYYYNKFFNDLGFKENIDYKIKLYDTKDNLFNGFINEECNIILLFDNFPNDDIKNLIDNNSQSRIILLPANILKEEVFLKKNSKIIIDYIDLNLLASSYLPKKINDFIYTVYKPDLKIFSFNTNLITNVNTDNIHVYSFINFFHSNYKFINNNLNDKSFLLQSIKLDNNTIYIDYHQGAINFFKKYGYISTINNENCKYFVGIMECNDKNLRDNNFIT